MNRPGDDQRGVGQKSKRLALVVGNSIVLLRYLTISVSVLLGLRHEALSGESVIWPLRVMLVSSVMFAVSIVLSWSTMQVVRRRAPPRKILVASLLLLSVLEFHETFMLHFMHSPIHLYDVSAYIYGPLLLVWAMVNWLFLE